MNDRLQDALKKLRLSGMAHSLDVRLQEATANSLNPQEFLELIVQDELDTRKDRLIARRVKVADFRDPKHLDDFNWGFNPSVPKKPIFELATGKFIQQAKDVLLLGPPGVGKSHLAQAIGHQAILLGFAVLYRSVFDLVRELMQDETLSGEDKTLARYLKPELLIIDDMGIKQLPKRSGEYLFEIVMRRYEKRSTLMTSNRPIEEWGKLLGDVPAASAILDRFLHHAEIITIQGRSYRLKDRPKAEEPQKKGRKEQLHQESVASTDKPN